MFTETPDNPNSLALIHGENQFFSEKTKPLFMTDAQWVASPKHEREAFAGKHNLALENTLKTFQNGRKHIMDLHAERLRYIRPIVVTNDYPFPINFGLLIGNANLKDLESLADF